MRFLPQLLWNGWGLRVGWKWAPIGGLQYQTHMQAPKYDVQFLRSDALRVNIPVAVVVAAGRGKLKNVR